jgi:replicative superfamily II helicase
VCWIGRKNSPKSFNIRREFLYQNILFIFAYRIVEVSGDNMPELSELNRAAILITTPEKWDGITRMADRRQYVKEVELMIIDEVHLLGI